MYSAIKTSPDASSFLTAFGGDILLFHIFKTDKVTMLDVHIKDADFQTTTDS